MFFGLPMNELSNNVRERKKRVYKKEGNFSIMNVYICIVKNLKGTIKKHDADAGDSESF